MNLNPPPWQELSKISGKDGLATDLHLFLYM